MVNHDNGYKRLFSHASVVADLLRGFVKEDWVKEVDLRTLERVEGSFVTSDLRSRETDMLWKVQWHGGPLFIFIVLEFQSRVDPFMAVRTMTYHGLLLEYLVREKAFTPSGKLPPAFILVLYNGNAPWGAALDVADLIEPLPGGLEGYRPHASYVLLDAARIPKMDLEPADNVAVALFRLEQSRDVEGFRQEIIRLLANQQVEEEVRASVHTWLIQVLMPARFPDLPLSEAQSLEEVRTMLADRVMEWTREWEQKGREEGIHAFQDFLLSEMEERFGPVPETIRLRVEETQDFQELKRFGKRLRAAGSLADLGF
jgi:Putative transposase, YhgA-like